MFIDKVRISVKAGAGGKLFGTHLGKRFYPSTTSTFIVPLTS